MNKLDYGSGQITQEDKLRERAVAEGYILHDPIYVNFANKQNNIIFLYIHL